MQHHASVLEPGSEASGNFVLDQGHADLLLAGIGGEADIRVAREAREILLVLCETVMEVVFL